MTKILNHLRKILTGHYWHHILFHFSQPQVQRSRFF